MIRSAIVIWNDDAWVADAAAYALRLGNSRQYAMVLSSGPPHAAHVAGAQVAEGARAPHIVDMRDPWGGTELVLAELHTPWLQRSMERGERKALASAGLVVLNTEPAARDFRNRFPHPAERAVVVYNGADAGDAVIRGSAPKGFRIVFTGSLYMRRNPAPTFAALRQLVEEHKLSTSDVEFHLMGHVRTFEGQAVEEMAREAGVLPYVHFHPPGPRNAALELSASASVLVTLGIHSVTQVPAKLFEYTDFAAMLLVEAPTNSATALLLAHSTARVVEPGDVTAIAAALGDAWSQFNRGEPFIACNADGRFSREAQLDRLMGAVEPYLSRAPVAT